MQYSQATSSLFTRKISIAKDTGTFYFLIDDDEKNLIPTSILMLKLVSKRMTVF